MMSSNAHAFSVCYALIIDDKLTLLLYALCVVQWHSYVVCIMQDVQLKVKLAYRVYINRLNAFLITGVLALEQTA